jgi:hypothetical protein
VGKVFADDVAAGGAEDIADEEDIHWKSLHGGGYVSCATWPNLARQKLGEGGPPSLVGVVASCHGTEWAVSTERAGVGGAGE